jgi:hypothetical protein
MKKLLIAATIATLAAGGIAFAQSGGGAGSGGTGSAATGGGSANPSVPPALTSDQRVTGGAPVGHRQPRRDGVGNADGDINQIDPRDAELDRKIKSICRGC